MLQNEDVCVPSSAGAQDQCCVQFGSALLLILTKPMKLGGLSQQLFLSGVSAGKEIPAVSWAPRVVVCNPCRWPKDTHSSSLQTESPVLDSGLQGLGPLQALWPRHCFYFLVVFTWEGSQSIFSFSLRGLDSQTVLRSHSW